ncbi:MAG TPA: acyl carrier protein [Urbifossiella sp.]|nr:acyl carrier protein [Urbifossiella sp.]
MISPELKAVLLKALGLDDYPFTSSTLATDVVGWDSLKHIEIIGRVEAAFGVRFRAYEVVNLPDVGALQRLVDGKLAAKNGRAAG